MFIKVSWLYFFFVTLIVLAKVYANHTSWLNRLTRYIKVEAYQVLLLLDADDRTASLHAQNIIQRISKSAPTWKINFQEATNQKAEELSLLPSFADLTSTIVVVVIHSSNDNQNQSQLKYQVEFLSTISKARMRPKCLIIDLQDEIKNSTHKSLLQYMWSKRFLDVTVVDLLKKQPVMRNRFLNHDVKMVTIHSYNPFTKIYTKKNYNRKILWFPEKTNDMNGYQMKVGLFPIFPAVSMTHDLTGNIVAFGYDVSITQELASIMNFKIKWVTSDVPTWGVGSCFKDNATGFFRQIMNNEINFVAAQSGRAASMCSKQLFEWSRGTRFVPVAVVLPNIHADYKQITTEWKLLNLLFLVSFVMCPLIISLIFHFEKRSWNTLNILRIVLGQVTPHEPQRLIERVLFAYILVACLLYSSFFYTAFTSIAFIQKKQGTKVNTIKDVLDLGLQPIVDESRFNRLMKVTAGDANILINKAKVLNLTAEECLQKMVEEKNIACILREESAQLRMKRLKNDCGLSAVKFAEEYVVNSFNGMPMEFASPYVRRFNELTIRFRDSGLIEKWQYTSVNESKIVGDEFGSCYLEKDSVDKIRKLFGLLLVLGYLCSLIAFLGERLLAYIMKRYMKCEH